MRLTELEPRWLSDNLFVFRCPHCRKTWLSCKNVPLSIEDQFTAFRAADLDPGGPRYAVVPMRAEFAWTITGREFETVTVTPSIDASRAGHWHGVITNGEATP